MVFRVSILVRDANSVFDWTGNNIASDKLVRQIGKSVKYTAQKQGALMSLCSPDDPDRGWVVQVVVKDRETADRILSAWSCRSERCDLDVFGDAHS